MYQLEVCPLNSCCYGGLFCQLFNEMDWRLN
uniref:Uncharacterized protein n=1 Tax=Anguilla anguilla TaxID=7936 RepID=A0A0E9UD29_ANGAN